MEPEPTQLSDIPPTEIERLLRIMSAAQGFLRHDLLNEGIEVKFFFERIQGFFDGSMTDKELRRLKDRFFAAKSSLNNFLKVVDVHLVGKNVTWSLRSHLPSIARLIISNLEERHVTVLPPHGPSINVTFPRNALYSIMSELARNATVHAPETQVALEWSIQPGVLIVSVHDGGKALLHSLTDRLLALDLVYPEIFKTGGGLSIIRRIVHWSEGLLLVRRSEILGGAEFSVRLPISSYFEGEK